MQDQNLIEVYICLGISGHSVGPKADPKLDAGQSRLNSYAQYRASFLQPLPLE